MSNDRKPPAYKVHAKLKDKGTAKEGRPEWVTLFSVWEDAYGRMSMTAERAFHERPGVKCIVLTDGTVLSPDDYWLNVTSARPSSKPRPPKDDDDIGF